MLGLTLCNAQLLCSIVYSFWIWINVILYQWCTIGVPMYVWLIGPGMWVLVHRSCTAVGPRVWNSLPLPQDLNHTISSSLHWKHVCLIRPRRYVANYLALCALEIFLLQVHQLIWGAQVGINWIGERRSSCTRASVDIDPPLRQQFNFCQLQFKYTTTFHVIFQTFQLLCI